MQKRSTLAEERKYSNALIWNQSSTKTLEDKAKRSSELADNFGKQNYTFKWRKINHKEMLDIMRWTK